MPRPTRLLARALAPVVLATCATAVSLPAVDARADAPDLSPWIHPVPPSARCTTSEALSGDVGHCLLRFYDDPNVGWGNAPAPGVGPGWVWSGYSYSGSPALADFEATYIASNTEPVGSIATGTLETHRDVRVLFEGFLAEVQANGYRVRHAAGYTFRCTGDWDCSSGGADDLSLHAWGLAIDMNSDANPIRTYADCSTPVATDMPEWMIRTAERWGLYWGGYGWNSGCNRPDSQNTNVTRDTPHFEFRGTPEMARAIATYNLAIDPTMRCFVTVDADGTDVERCNRAGVPEAGWRLPVTTDAPSGTRAVLVNLTATDAASPGYLTLEDCGPRPTGPRETSTVTYAATGAAATLAIVPLDADGRFCVYRASAVHSVVDVVGYLVDVSANGPSADPEIRWVRPREPNRLLDTRETGAPVPAGGELPVSGLTGGAIVNLGAVADAHPGYLQLGACDTLGPSARFSNVNYLGNTPHGPSIRSNLAMTELGDRDTCVYARGRAHVVVDLLATLDRADGYGWNVGEAQRALDTRTTGRRVRAGQLIELDLETDAPGAVLALTVTEPGAAGYLTVAPCDELETQLADAGRPSTSNLNHTAGETLTNLATTALVDGRTCVYSRADAHVVVDVQATFTAERTLGLVVGDPVRTHDTRAH